MALFLLNCSIDSPDYTPPHTQEDLSVNDQESLIEFVLEKVMGLGDIIPEADDRETDGLKTALDLFVLFAPSYPFSNTYLRPRKSFLNRGSIFYSNPFLSHHSPPPEC